MRRYSLAQLEALLAISRLGSFQLAANQLNITQPTVSLRIRELEDALGVALFERQGRTARLTPDGLAASQYAERVMKLLDDMETRLRSGDPLHGKLRVGASEMMAIAVLPRIMSLLGDRYPRLEAELTVSNSFVLADALSAGQLDVAFLADPGYLNRIHVEPLALAPVAWIGSTAKRLPVTLISPEVLADTTVLCMPDPSPLNDTIARWWEEEGGVGLTMSTCNSLAVLARMVTAGLGVSVMPTCILRDEIQKGNVLTYRQAAPFAPLTICAAYPAASKSSGIAALVSIARRVMLDSRHFMAIRAQA